MWAADDANPKRWFDEDIPQDHIRDAAHLLARVVMLVASMACW